MICKDGAHVGTWKGGEQRPQTCQCGAVRLYDQRDCPKCFTRMEMKFEVAGAEIWQCTDCKNIERLFGA